MTGDEQHPETIDLEAFGLGEMAKKARAATFAPNWKTVLAADALVGLLIVAAGIGLLLWRWFAGVPVIIAGAFYLFLVLRRFLQWRWLRRQVGLDAP